MKKIATCFVLLFLSGFPVYAASTITATANTLESGAVLVVVDCIAHTDGTFTSTMINLPQIKGKRIINAWTVNNFTTYPASGAVTITDATGQQLIGSTVGDTLTLSTSAAGVAHLVIDRGSGQRTIVANIGIAVSTVTTNSGRFTLYLLCG
jgi:hypothetical protein